MIEIFTGRFVYSTNSSHTVGIGFLPAAGPGRRATISQCGRRSCRGRWTGAYLIDPSAWERGWGDYGAGGGVGRLRQPQRLLVQQKVLHWVPPRLQAEPLPLPMGVALCPNGATSNYHNCYHGGIAIRGGLSWLDISPRAVSPLGACPPLPPRLKKGSE